MASRRDKLKGLRKPSSLDEPVTSADIMKPPLSSIVGKYRIRSKQNHANLLSQPNPHTTRSEEIP
jgi:hypothetical protein